MNPEVITSIDLAGRLPILSVVIPTWNCADLLDRLLHSVSEAITSQEVEFVVVDDGSLDNTRQIVEKWLIALNLRYVPIEHHGVSIARNRGIEIAQGDHVGFFDSDDTVDPGWFEEVLEILREQPDIDVISIGKRVIDVNGDESTHYPSGGPTLESFRPVASAGSIVYRKQLLVAVEGFDETLRSSEFSDLWRRVLKQYQGSYLRCVVIAKPLYSYRKRYGSTTMANHEALLNGTTHWLELIESGELDYSQEQYAVILGQHAVNLRRTGNFIDSTAFAKRSFLIEPTLKRALRILMCALGPVMNWIERSGLRKPRYRRPLN